MGVRPRHCEDSFRGASLPHRFAGRRPSYQRPCLRTAPCLATSERLLLARLHRVCRSATLPAPTTSLRCRGRRTAGGTTLRWCFWSFWIKERPYTSPVYFSAAERRLDDLLLLAALLLLGGGSELPSGLRAGVLAGWLLSRSAAAAGLRAAPTSTCCFQPAAAALSRRWWWCVAAAAAAPPPVGRCQQSLLGHPAAASLKHLQDSDA